MMRVRPGPRPSCVRHRRRLARRRRAGTGSLLEGMGDSLVHRGPDDAGLYLKGPVGLGVRRLSVLDLTQTGHQPMGNRDGTLWIVVNGEIYNYVELAQELRSLGRRLVSQSDTEVLLHLYSDAVLTPQNFAALTKGNGLKSSHESPPDDRKLPSRNPRWT